VPLGAGLLAAVALLVEAVTVRAVPPALFFWVALHVLAVVLSPEAAARVELPLALHSFRAKLALALVFLEEAHALTAEQGGLLGRGALLQPADPLISAARALASPPEANAVFALLLEAFLLSRFALALSVTQDALLTDRTSECRRALGSRGKAFALSIVVSDDLSTPAFATFAVSLGRHALAGLPSVPDN